ncbi:serine/threonine-protein phosphatase 4 regulatory subunit 2 [Microdochium nivale]|nr:serine/threonine-protein phosphatase 4 regulatory subunit 2 [Microdochium nivale]
MMETDDNDVLSAVAASGTMEYSLWPALMPRIVSRIEQIARDEFPMPQVPSPISYPAEPWTFPEDSIPPMPPTPPRPSTPHSSREANKENDPDRPPRVIDPLAHPSGPVVDPAHGEIMSGRYAHWPQALAIKIAYITHTLETYFTTYPPHTIQRLAELLLEPKRHYKSLPAFLHAVDRVVHVTSGLNVYPLPPAVQENFSGTLLSNGVSAEAVASAPALSPFAAPGSDEALGGALLTPIPWLTQPAATSPPPGSSATATPDTVGEQQVGVAAAAAASSSTSPTDMEGQVRTESTETIEGPNGMGSVETVSVSVNGVPSMGARGVGVTQGELLRQEQKAGVVPVSQLVPGHHTRHQGAMMMQQQRLAAGVGISSSSATDIPDGEGRRTTTASEETMDDDDGGDGDHEGHKNRGKDDTDGAATASVHTLDEEKSHARGPEEIGLEDTGLQHDTSGGHLTAITTSNANGSSLNMHGIDIEAAVGRRATGRPANDADDHDMNEVDGEDSEDISTDKNAAAAATSTTSDDGKAETKVGDQMEVDNDDCDDGDAADTPTASSTGTIGRSREGTPTKREADAGDTAASKMPKATGFDTTTEEAQADEAATVADVTSPTIKDGDGPDKEETSGGAGGDPQGQQEERGPGRT